MARRQVFVTRIVRGWKLRHYGGGVAGASPDAEALVLAFGASEEPLTTEVTKGTEVFRARILGPVAGLGSGGAFTTAATKATKGIVAQVPRRGARSCFFLFFCFSLFLFFSFSVFLFFCFSGSLVFCFLFSVFVFSFQSFSFSVPLFSCSSCSIGSISARHHRRCARSPFVSFVASVVKSSS